MTTPTTQISTTLLWQIYNTLLNTEATLNDISGVWDTDSKQGSDISFAHQNLATLIGKFEPIVSSIKDIDSNSN
jgi:hypothetical protein